MSLETSTNEASQPMDPSEPFDRTTPSGLSVTSTKGEEESPDAGEHVIEKHNDEPTRPLDADVEKQAIQDLPPSAPPPEKDPDLVEFDGPRDPGNPLNWPVRKRIAITLSMGMMTFVVTFGKSWKEDNEFGVLILTLWQYVNFTYPAILDI